MWNILIEEIVQITLSVLAILLAVGSLILGYMQVRNNNAYNFFKKNLTSKKTIYILDATVSLTKKEITLWVHIQGNQWATKFILPISIKELSNNLILYQAGGPEELVTIGDVEKDKPYYETIWKKPLK